MWYHVWTLSTTIPPKQQRDMRVTSVTGRPPDLLSFFKVTLVVVVVVVFCLLKHIQRLWYRQPRRRLPPNLQLSLTWAGNSPPLHFSTCVCVLMHCICACMCRQSVCVCEPRKTRLLSTSFTRMEIFRGYTETTYVSQTFAECRNISGHKNWLYQPANDEADAPVTAFTDRHKENLLMSSRRTN